MAYIKTLKDNELIGGTDNTDVYPVSTTQAIFSQKPDGTIPEGIKHQRLEERLEDHEEDAQTLHREVEQLVPSIGVSYSFQDMSHTIDETDIVKGRGYTVEIDGETHTLHIAGSAVISTYGDAADVVVEPEDMTAKDLVVISGATSMAVNNKRISDHKYLGDFQFPNVVGSYTAKFSLTYNGVSKNVTQTSYLNLRKYFGFAGSQPSDVTTLSTSQFSNSVGCTITIPVGEGGFQHIYFAVPNGMSITRVTQPDALNAPLAITQVGTVTRTISGTSFTYKLYQSTDLIDSSVSKRLTIS